MLRYRALAPYELEFDQIWNGFGLTSQAIQCEAPQTIAKLVYNYNNYGLRYIYIYI